VKPDRIALGQPNKATCAIDAGGSFLQCRYCPCRKVHFSFGATCFDMCRTAQMIDMRSLSWYNTNKDEGADDAPSVFASYKRLCRTMTQNLSPPDTPLLLHSHERALLAKANAGTRGRLALAFCVGFGQACPLRPANVSACY